MAYQEPIHLDVAATRQEPFASIAAAIGYTGRTMKLVAAANPVTLGSRYWDGGTRSTWTLFDLATLRRLPLGNVPGFQDPPQFGGLARNPQLQVEAGQVLVEHAIFCGKDMGLRVYAAPATLAPMLPAAVELSEGEAVVLIVTSRLKGSYGGRKPRHEAAARHGIDAAAFEKIRADLAKRGLLTTQGAITATGRNAIAGHPLRNRID